MSESAVELEHVGEVSQTNTDMMILRCVKCQRNIRAWDIAQETVLVSDICSSWAEHERDAQ